MLVDIPGVRFVQPKYRCLPGLNIERTSGHFNVDTISLDDPVRLTYKAYFHPQPKESSS